MSTFKYELESLLNVREKLEDIKQKEYAESLELLKQKKDIKNKIDDSLNHSTLTFKNSISNSIDARQIKMQHNYRRVLEKKKGLATQNLEKAKKKSKQQHKELLSAMRNRKTLEILKDKKYDQFIEQEKRVEQQVIDEIICFAHKQA